MIILLILGLLGVVVSFLIKVKSLIDTFARNNEVFVWAKFWKRDWPTYVMAVIFVVVLAMFKDEIFTYKPALEKYVKLLFFFIGVNGVWVFQAVQSIFKATTKNYINKITDVKTNVADEVIAEKSKAADAIN